MLVLNAMIIPRLTQYYQPSLIRLNIFHAERPA